MLNKEQFTKIAVNNTECEGKHGYTDQFLSLLGGVNFSGLDIFDIYFSQNNLSALSACKGLEELVLFPILSGSQFNKQLDSVCFTRLQSLYLGLVVVEEDEWLELMKLLPEATPNLQVFKQLVMNFNFKQQQQKKDV